MKPNVTKCNHMKSNATTMKTNLLTFCFICLGFIASAQDIFKLMLAESDAKFAKGEYIEAYKDYTLLYRDEAFAHHADTLRLRLQRTRTAIDSMKIHLQATIDKANARQRSYELSCLEYAEQQEKLRWLDSDKNNKPEDFSDYDVTQLNLSGFGLVQLPDKIRDYRYLKTIDLTHNPLLDSVQVYTALDSSVIGWALKKRKYLKEIKTDKNLSTKTISTDFINKKQNELKKLTEGLTNTTENIKNILHDAYYQFTIGNYSTTLGFYEMINAITPKHKTYLKQLEDIVFETVEYSIAQMRAEQQKAEEIQQNADIVTFDRAAKNINPNFGTCRNFTDNVFLQVDSLSFEAFGLTQMPELISKCKNLLHINLLYNYDLDLYQLDKVLNEIPSVNSIWLTISDWEKVPPTLKQKITGIRWRATALPNSDSDFWQQKQWVYLDVSGNDLTSLPEQIGQLSTLTSLNLSGNHLTSLPKKIGQLKNLVELNLSGNDSLDIVSLCTAFKDYQRQIEISTDYFAEKNDDNSKLLIKISEQKSLPEQIGQLSSLTTLDLSDNQLTRLPEQIGQLSSLTSLNLWSNELTSLPKQIVQLSSLTSLDLGGNGLTSLPKQIGQLSSLTELYLGGNQLTSLPKQIGQLSSLTTLVLSRNNLTSLPEQIGQLSSLTTLDLEDNKLKSLPKQIGQLSSLKELDLRENKLTSLPNQIGQLSSLTKLLNSKFLKI